MTHSIDVSVTVSQALRDLLAGRDRSDDTPSSGTDPEAEDLVSSSHDTPKEDPHCEDTSATETETTADDAIPWPFILLRRDGDRPTRFRGQAVVGFSGPCDLGGWDCTQDVTLFVTQHREVYLSLSLHPPEGAGARPVFDCFEMTQTPLDHVLARWSTRIRDHIPVQRSVTAPAVPQIAPADVSAGFHTITAHCFRAEPSHSERIEECLQ